jgi:hypothetical protein
MPGNRGLTLAQSWLALQFCAAPLFAADAHQANAASAAPATSLVVQSDDSPFVMGQGDSIITGATFKPPVEITLVAKTDSNNIRMGYAANQIIFNWELNPQQLRVDGGPADKKHKAGAGSIPVNEYVTIKWLVTPQKQSIFVNGELRFEHEGDYSDIDNPVKVFTHKARITVKSLEVKPLPSGK